LNRGIIPKDVDLTPAFEKGAPPVQFRGMKFHDKSEMYAKQEIHTEKFSKNSIKFDLTNIEKSYKAAISSLNCSGSSRKECFSNDWRRDLVGSASC